MSRRRLLRKYQAGGVIPSFEGANILSRPLQVNLGGAPPVRPFDPAAVFQGIQARELNKRSAISQADLNRQERRLIWEKEVDNRDYLQARLTELNLQLQAGLDSMTNLNMNSPLQMKMANDIKRSTDAIIKQGMDIFSDNSLLPQERAARLQELTIQAQALYNNPEYKKNVQRNVIAQKVLDKIFTDSQDQTLLLDPAITNDIVDAATRYLNGEIELDKFSQVFRPYAIDVKGADALETRIHEMMKDSLLKGPEIFEKYNGDPDAIIFFRILKTGDPVKIENAVYDMLMRDEAWKRKQEVHPDGRNFRHEDGVLDEGKVREYVKDLVSFYRDMYGFEEGETQRVVGADVTRKLSGQTSGGDVPVIQDLEASGYRVIFPSAFFADDSAAEVLRILRTPDDELTEGLEVGEAREIIKRKREYEDSLEYVGQKTEPVQTAQPEAGGDVGAVEGTGVELSTGSIYTPPEQVLGSASPAIASLESEESTGGVNMVNRNDAGQASVGPLQFRGELGQEFLSELGIEGFDLTREMTPEEEQALNDRFDEIGRDNVLAAGREFFERNILPELDERMKQSPSLLDTTPEITEALKVPLYSMLVNHSSKGKDIIMEKVEEKLSKIDNATEKDKIKAIQDSRKEYINSLKNMPESTKQQLIDRYTREQATAMAIIERREVDDSTLVDALELQKEQIQEQNIFNDDISGDIERIDGIIETVEGITEELKNIDPGESKIIDIGASRITPTAASSTTIAGLGPSTNVSRRSVVNLPLTVQRSRDGGAFRIKSGDKILADGLTSVEAQVFLSELAGNSIFGEIKPFVGTALSKQQPQSKLPSGKPVTATDGSNSANKLRENARKRTRN